MRTWLLLCLFAATATAALAVPTREEALAAIATLESDLTSDDAADAAKVITEFARDSEDVNFVVGPDTMPWLADERSPGEAEDPASALLLAVYLAGNAKSQLLSNRNEDDPYSGWVAVLRAYRKLQAQRSLSIPALDELGEMEKNGTLAEHARDVKEKEQRANRREEAERLQRDSI